MNLERDKKDVKHKKARFIKFIQKIIRLGVFLLVVGMISVALFNLKPVLKPGYKSDDVRKIYCIILFTVGIVLALGGAISYASVKSSLLKNLRAENTANGNGDVSADDEAIFQAYMRSIEPTESESESVPVSEKALKRRKIFKNVTLGIMIVYGIVSLALIIGTILILNRCANYAPETYEYGDYFYCLDGNDKAVILGLTEEGQLEEYLIIPAEIDGRKTSVGCSDMYQARAIERRTGSQKNTWANENLKKVFLSTETRINHYGWSNRGSVFSYNINLQAIVFIGEDAEYAKNYFYSERFAKCLVLCQSSVYENDETAEDGKIYAEGAFAPANVSYKYNYDGAENDGYYFIDDYDGTVINFIPPEPTRENYVFGGWYKEKECINIWDFESDVVPPKNAEENVWEYAETALYAKWITE
ncbi:MAG: InlB B-repeat-containing protein [Clostridia bacterium]|nr:InlB B-repeat-containing protein [Clostridia bacterium]